MRGKAPGKAKAAPKRRKRQVAESSDDESDDDESDDEEFEVDAIIAHRGESYGLEYLVQWGGEYKGEETWQPLDDVAGCDAFLEYKRRTGH